MVTCRSCGSISVLPIREEMLPPGGPAHLPMLIMHYKCNACGREFTGPPPSRVAPQLITSRSDTGCMTTLTKITVAFTLPLSVLGIAAGYLIYWSNSRDNAAGFYLILIGGMWFLACIIAIRDKYGEVKPSCGTRILRLLFVILFMVVLLGGAFWGKSIGLQIISRFIQ